MAATDQLTPTEKTERDPAGEMILPGLGIVFLALCGGVVFVSREFTFGRWDIEPLVWQYIALAMALGGVLLALLFLLPKMRPTRRALMIVFAVGLAARAMMFASNPVLEDDWHRYLWDGASVANGVDPYRFAPAEASSINRLGEVQDWSDDPALVRLQELTEADYTVYSRVNYPYFKTIYPPVAQAGFALAHFIAPFSLNGWRAVLLLIDIGSFALIVYALGLFGRSALWAGLYWWNPVVILEVFNAGHMDALIVPFLVGALALVKSGRTGWAVAALAGAAAVKLWPVLLAPALVRRHMFDLKQLVPLALLFCLLAGLLLAPQLRYVFTDPDQGLVAYSEAWRRHAFIYSVLVEGPFVLFGDPVLAARNFIAVCVAGGALWIAWRSPADARGLAAAMLSVTALLIFLSPTGYPWYQVWLAGLIPFAPRLGFVALTVAAPIYYTRFVFGDENPLYQWGLVPLAFGLPLILLVVPETYYRRWPHARADQARPN